MLPDTSEQEVRGSSSIIGFIDEGGRGPGGFDRYLTVEGEKAFHIGNVCGTCSFFLERLGGANQSVDVEAIVEVRPNRDLDPVIEAYKKDIDVTLIRENLRLTLDQRFQQLMKLQQFAEDLRPAGRKTRSQK